MSRKIQGQGKLVLHRFGNFLTTETLDAGLGIVHADAKGRQSLALDLMEPVRPEVDGFVLDMVARRTFRKAEFSETADGHVRLLAPLTHELAETMPQWAKSLSPIAEHVAHVFGKAMDGTYSAATSLTSRRHRDAQEVVKASASDIRRGKWTPHVSTWAALGQLVGVFVGQAP